mmetsp:Transcript_17212/g.25923  ORF Transcript_17212/g.25923 Transcript_17212/m.25923 type:complete len:387 (-) Transcript_17212:1334-2494(-)
MWTKILIGLVLVARKLNGLDVSGKKQTMSNRRQLLTGMAASLMTPLLALPEEAEAQTVLDMAVQLGALGSTRPYALDSRTGLSALAAKDAVKSLLNVQTIWLGEHRTDAVDHEMEAGIVAAVAVAKAANGGQPCVGVGLEAVRTEYQSVLDDFVSGKMPANLQTLAKATKWAEHWPYPIESYDSVLALCRELELPILALGASSPDIDKIEHQGLAALDKDAWNRLDLPEGATILANYNNAQFINKEVPSFESSSLFQNTAGTLSTFANHYCGRLVWDESMAARAAAWIEAHQDEDPTLLVLTGAEHVTNGCGAPDRCARRLIELERRSERRSDNVENKSAACSILINPRVDDFMLATPIEASTSSRVPNKPLADLVWFSPWSEQFL